MLARLGWIGTALATGLLLQIAVQVNSLHWLPDFPVYLGLALLAAGSGIVGSFLWLVAAASKAQPVEGTPHAPFWLRMLVIGSFALLTIVHAVLALGSSSTAIEWWRNTLLWPALLLGVTGCVLTAPRWRAILVWQLGESAAALLGCWYATSHNHLMRIVTCSWQR